MIQFKIDENLPVDAAVLLQEGGYYAETVFDEGNQGSPDTDLLQVCRQENRVLVTLDLDFADIRSYPPNEYPGLIVLRSRWQDRPHILGLLRKILVHLGEEPLEGHLWIVEEDRIRIRSSD